MSSETRHQSTCYVYRRISPFTRGRNGIRSSVSGAYIQEQTARKDVIGLYKALHDAQGAASSNRNWRRSRRLLQQDADKVSTSSSRSLMFWQKIGPDGHSGCPGVKIMSFASRISGPSGCHSAADRSNVYPLRLQLLRRHR